MATLSFIFIFLATLFFTFLLHLRRGNKKDLPWNWPLIGIIPWLLLHSHKLNRGLVELLERSCGTFLNKSRGFLGHDILFTSDPANVHHIMSSKFLTYEKGLAWKKRFDAFGESLFNFDFDEWSYHRRAIRGFVCHQEFQRRAPEAIRDCIAEGLIPFLERASEQDKPVVVDLQNVFQRLMFDFASTMITGYRSNSLGAIDSAEPPFLKAIDNVGEAIVMRYFLPETLWKLQSWLNVGKEKDLRVAKETLKRVFEDYFLTKQDELRRRSNASGVEFNLLELYMTGHEGMGEEATSYELIKGQIIGLLFAVEDTVSATLSWFFLLLSKNPSVERKIWDEITRNFPDFRVDGSAPGAKELNELVYTHAALCETLRLFPPVPLEARTPVQADTLPSGHRVDRKTMVLICGYAMGRMSRVWGNDSQEFSPERWITADGRIKHEPPNKFFAFLSGPRICPGKDVAFQLMKTVVVAMLLNFNINVSKEHRVKGKLSVVMHMKPGLTAKITRRFI